MRKNQALSDKGGFRKVTAETIIEHAKKKRKRGKNPSMAYCGIRNPHLALQKAKELLANDREMFHITDLVSIYLRCQLSFGGIDTIFGAMRFLAKDSRINYMSDDTLEAFRLHLEKQLPFIYEIGQPEFTSYVYFSTWAQKLEEEFGTYHEVSRMKALRTKLDDGQPWPVLKGNGKIFNSEFFIGPNQITDLCSFERCPGKADDLQQILWTFIYEVSQAVSIARGYTSGKTGISFYQLPLLINFILPALKNELTKKWRRDPLWNETVDTQIIQRIPCWRANGSQRALYYQFKRFVTTEQLQMIVQTVCKFHSCSVPELVNLIGKLKTMSKDWPRKYQM